ncbi:MAG: sensor histidine kinase [Chitinophagaceae bacterium]
MQGTRGISFFYFFLLLYTIAALLWWGIALFQQSREISKYETLTLDLKINRSKFPLDYQIQKQKILQRQKLRSFQYLSEGITFLLVILVGAGFVFRSTRKQMRLSHQQVNFMMAVTHELKSPIAVAKLNLETLLKRRLGEEMQLKLIDKTLWETNRLNHLCNNILLASQLESREYRLLKERMDFSNLVHQCLLENMGRISDHHLEEDIQEGIWIQGDPLMLNMAVSNLLENAVKYSPKGSLITVKLFIRPPFLHLQIKDEGEGIAEEEKSRIFTKFYRIGNENTRKSKGTGLGLFLTKKILSQHGAQIMVLNNDPKGSIFEISFRQFEQLESGTS